MRYLQTYEKYEQRLERAKKEIIKHFKDMFNKFDLPYLSLGMETEDNNPINFHFSHLSKDSVAGITITYEIYLGPNNASESVDDERLEDVPAEILIRLYDACEKQHRFTYDYLLMDMTMSGEPDRFIGILEDYVNSDSKENLSKNLYLSNLLDNEIDIENDFEFQDKILTLYPPIAATKEIKFLPEIKKKYSDLFDSEELGLL